MIIGGWRILAVQRDEFHAGDYNFETFMWEEVIFEFIDIKEAIFI